MFSCAPLVVRFGMLDDMVLLTPLLRLLHKRYGQPCRVIGSGSWLETLLAGDPDRWPEANWVALIRALLADPGDFTVLVCGAPSNGSFLQNLPDPAGSPRVHAAGDDLPLRRFMALCGHAAAMISVDSGRAQIAAAMGCPVIMLHGSRPPSPRRPRSVTGSPVQVLGGLPARNRMDLIALDEVLFAWHGLRTWRHASTSPDCPGAQGGASGNPMPDASP